MSPIYLDYAAGTPADPRVARTMKLYFSEKFGNPGSFHSFGQEAMAAVDFSRETIAKTISAGFREIIFTSSATEANNLALRGAVKAFSVERLASSEKSSLAAINYTLTPRIIVSAIEHESVLETARDLEHDGIEIAILPVKKNGMVDVVKLPSLLDERTALVSVMHANNETGVIQPISEIAKIIEGFKKNQSPVASSQWPLFHTDAAQSFQFLDCSMKELGVDLMTLSAHKIYGPKGVGALYVRQATRDKRQGGNNSMLHVALPIFPTVTGGGQEFGLRSGTENVPLIVGFAKAVELLGSRELWNKKIAGLRDHFIRGMKKIIPRVEVNGSNAPRLPHIASVYLPNFLAEDTLTFLDLHGVAISSGSACRARSLTPSHVLLAMGFSKEYAKRSIRVSFGRMTTRKEIDKALAIIKNMYERS